MGRRCCVCKIYSVPGSGISFHSFPLIDSYRKQWIEAIPIRININNPNLLICSQHFNESDFKFGRYGRRFLPKAAIPSKFETISSQDLMIVGDVDTPVEFILSEDHLCNEDNEDLLPSFDEVIGNNNLAMATTLSIESEPTNNVIEIKQGSNISEMKCFSLSKKKYRTSKWDNYFKQCNEALLQSTYFHDYLGKSLVPCNFEYMPNEDVMEDKQVVYPHLQDFLIETDQNLLTMTNELHQPEVCRNSDTESSPENDLTQPLKSSIKAKKQKVRNFNPKQCEKLKRQLTMARNVITQKKRKIKILQQSKRRLQKKLNTMGNAINDLKASQIISEETDLSSLPSSSTEVVKRILQGSNSAKYSPELKKFAITLFFYSRKAYEYVRNVFNDSLPHPRTIAKWFEKNNETGATAEPIPCLPDQSDIIL